MYTPEMIILPTFDAFLFKRRLDTVIDKVASENPSRAKFLLSECYVNLVQPMVQTNIKMMDRSMILKCLKELSMDINKDKLENLHNFVAEMCYKHEYGGVGDEEQQQHHCIVLEKTCVFV
jgi:hypothetical protein